MTDAAAAPPPAAAPAADDPDADDAEGFGMSDVLLDSVTKDEWKSIEQSLSHHKKTVAEMLKRSCSQIRTKGDLVLDESNGKFLGDMLTEMENFASYCYRAHVRPKIVALLPVELEVDDVEAPTRRARRVAAAPARRRRRQEGRRRRR